MLSTALAVSGCLKNEKEEREVSNTSLVLCQAVLSVVDPGVIQSVTLDLF